MSRPRYESVIFYSALGLSILIHVWFFAVWMIARLPQSNTVQTSVQEANITYFSPSSQISSVLMSDHEDGGHALDFQLVSQDSMAYARNDRDEFLNHDIDAKDFSREPDFLMPAVKSEKSQKPIFQQSTTNKSSPKVSLEKISIPMMASGSIRPDNYPDYFNRIGEKIRKKAYEMVKRRRQISGEVRVSFVLDSRGDVKDVRVFDKGVDSEGDLRNFVTDIVRSASPFESFPAEMGTQDLSCEVLIEFR